MDHFHYRDGELCAEGVSLRQLADEVGTPFFCYSTATLERHYRVFSDAIEGLDATICYAVKANSNIAVIATLANLGAGADVVSGGELRRALAAGVPADKIVFSGVGKTRDELSEALSAGIMQINVESEPELNLLSEVATAMGVEADIAVRINPDVDARTHEKITTGKSENKFGIELALARSVFSRVHELPGIRLRGVAVHIGSQLTDLEPYRAAYERVAEFVHELRADGIDIRHVDLGGGLGIPYGEEEAPSPAEYGALVKSVLSNLGCSLTFEPGRVIAGNAGVLVTRVIFVKEGLSRRFCIVDGAMNDLIRPSLYDAFHAVIPVVAPPAGATWMKMDVVGPICESGDFIAKERNLPELESGDLLAVRTAGAYGAVMSSAYNSRPLAPEVLVSGDRHSVVRQRMTIEAMIDMEDIPRWLVTPEEKPAESRG